MQFPVSKNGIRFDYPARGVLVQLQILSGVLLVVQLGRRRDPDAMPSAGRYRKSRRGSRGAQVQGRGSPYHFWLSHKK